MKEKLIQFMQGRYGIDTLNNHALFLSSLYLSLIYSLIIESLCHLDILFGF